MRRRYILSLLVLLLIGFTWPGGALAAGGDRFNIDVQSGLKGKVQEGKGFPVTVTVQNNGKDFSGDLLVTIPKNFESVGKLVIPIDLAAGATKKFTFSVPGMVQGYFSNGNPGQNQQQFHLYEGSWKSGDEVKVDPKLKIHPSYLPQDDAVIGVLSSDPDALNYFKLTNVNGRSASVIALDGKDLPHDATGLEVLDVLVINDFAVSGLPKEVRKAIKGWVDDGGNLIVGSTPGMAQQLGSLTKWLPFAVKGEKTVSALPEFEKVGKTPLSAKHFNIMTGKVKDSADVVEKHGKNPLVVREDVGEGTISQYNFDLANPAFSDWKGVGRWWHHSLGQLSIQHSNPNDPYMDPASQLSQVSSAFQSVAKLPLTGLLLLLIAYLIIVVPVMYFLLKRLDRREWSWVAVPVIAIICSIGLFAYGAKDRLGKIKTNAVSIVSVDENGMGSGVGSVSMLSHGSGDYTMSVNKDTDVFAVQSPGSYDASFANAPVLQHDAEDNKADFENVEFWSPRSLSVKLPAKDYGGFDTHFTFKDGKVTGEIKNRSSYDFAEITLFSGTQHYPLGALKAGETKPISFQVNSGQLFQAPAPSAIRALYHASGQSQQNDQKRWVKLQMAESLMDGGSYSFDSPILVGYTESPLYTVKVKGGRTDQQSNSLFIQTTSVRLPKGENIRFHSEIKTPRLSALKGNIDFSEIPKGAGGFSASAGVYELKYKLPKSLQEHAYKLKGITIQLRSGQNNTGFQVFNAKTGKFEKLDKKVAFIFNKHPENYVDHGTIRIRVKKSSGGSEDDIRIPQVVIEGVTQVD